MAKTTRTETARRSRNNARVNRGMYVEGNTVRRLAEVPERTRQPQTISGKTAAESKPQGAGPAGTGTKAETSVK